MRAIKSVSFGDVVSITFADSEDLREFAFVHRTVVLDPARGDYGDLLDALTDAAQALLQDVLEDLALTPPLHPTPVPQDEAVPEDGNEGADG